MSGISRDGNGPEARSRSRTFRRNESFASSHRAAFGPGTVSYDSRAVVPDGTLLPAVTNEVMDYAPTARPGSRAPHMWLRRGKERISTLDLFDRSFVLLTGTEGTAWIAAARDAAKRLRLPLDCHTVGKHGTLIDETGEWTSLYGVEPDGAVLVRPDGHVAWRARWATATPELPSVCRNVLDLA